jgi:iron complex outermembrane receptor protein
MLQHYHKALSVRLMGSAAAMALLASAGQGHAQVSSGPVAQVEELVVTGTLIRGVAPIGANVQSVAKEEIQRIGAMSTNQILANIPVISSQFNTTANTPTSVFLNVFRPTIRNITASGGNTTLVLVDGHNQVGVGTLQTTPDAGMIPAGAIERVEVLADGGSALYGADAVTGIVNYITRSKFDGFEVTSRFGAAEGGYEAYDINLTGGTSWDKGSIMVAITNRSNTPLYNSERDRPRQNLTPFGGSDFRVRTCNPGNITTGGATYALQGRVRGTLNLCDATELGNIAPEEHLYSVFTSITQEIAEGLRFDMKGIWSDRLTKSRSAQLTGANLTINRNNPFFQPIGAENSQVVNFNFAPYLGARQVATSEIKQYTITPELTLDLPGDWQAKALYNIGWSQTYTVAPQLAPNLSSYLNGVGLTTATALNPYNLLATSPQTLSMLTGTYKQLGYAIQTLNDIRAQADGPLFDLPGGTVRAAVGAEWQRSTLDALAGVPATGLNDPLIGRGNATRKVASVFGQIAVPVIGPDNALPLVQSFDLDLSARYDDYSDFGSTANPKVAFTWKVIDGLQIRGNWGKAFNAPSLGDTTGDSAHRAEYAATTVALAPGASAAVEGQRPSIAVTGGNPALKPQKADTYSFGVDYSPTFLNNLQMGVSFWSIDLRDIVGLAPRNNTIFTQPAYKNYYILNPTLAQVQALASGLPLLGFPTQNLADLYGNGADPYILIDVRKANFGTIKAQGVDFRASYRQPVSWGSVFGSVSGTRPTKREQQAAPGAVTADLLAADNSKLQISTTVGVTVGAFTASATQNRSQGYTLANTAGQSKIDDFAPINLAFRYEFSGGPAFTDQLSLTLNVDNVGDDLPPFQNVSGGTGNGSTLGRYVNVGIQKRF